MRKLMVVLLLGLAFLPAQAAKPADSTEPTAVEQRVSDNTTISVDFPNEDIRAILRNFADLFELNLVVPTTLHGRTSIKLRNVTWRQIFREVLAPQGYTFVEDGNIVRVVTRESLASLEVQPQEQSEDPPAEQQDESYFPTENQVLAALLLVLVPTILLRMILAIAVLRDRLAGQARFVPKLVWAALVLLGGVLPLLAYWFMHHSTTAFPPVLPQEPRKPN